MDIRLRAFLLAPGAEFFGAPTNQEQWENDVIWNGPGEKPTWAEIVAADDLETAFLEKAEAADMLDRSDKDMARVAEDVIGALIAKGVIALADLPDAVTAKMAEREAARAKL